MSAFSMTDLKTMMSEVLGADETIDLSGDIAHKPLADLGLDSLGILELTSIIQRNLHVMVTDEQLFEISTPEGLLRQVNDLLLERV